MVPTKPVSQNLKIWCRLMRNVSLKRMEVKCFAAQDVLGRKLFSTVKRCSGAVGRHFCRRRRGLERMRMAKPSARMLDARIWRSPVMGAK